MGPLTRPPDTLSPCPVYLSLKFGMGRGGQSCVAGGGCGQRYIYTRMFTSECRHRHLITLGRHQRCLTRCGEGAS
jgi:hypothetical protein